MTAYVRRNYSPGMSSTADKLEQEIKSLPDVEKLRLVDSILADLDRPDPEIDRIWAEEARKRWAAYKASRARTVSYEEVMSKYHETLVTNEIRPNTTHPTQSWFWNYTQNDWEPANSANDMLIHLKDRFTLDPISMFCPQCRRKQRRG